MNTCELLRLVLNIMVSTLQMLAIIITIITCKALRIWLSKYSVNVSSYCY